MTAKTAIKLAACASLTAALCTGCHSIEDRDLQEKWGTRVYAERVCAERDLQSADHQVCVDDKARRRLALLFCGTMSEGFFKEDVCTEAE